MALNYTHFCPYCGTHLSISRLSVEKTASRCPNCHRFLIVDAFGATIKKPNVYHCPKCGKEQIYDGRPPMVMCDGCNHYFVTSEYGEGMIEVGLLSDGDKGEIPYQKKPDRYVATINKWLGLEKSIKTKIISAIVVIILVAVAGYLISLPPAIRTTQAYADMDSLWTEFSEHNPYNIQIECIRHYDDGSKTVIISEPSDFVSEKDLNKFFKSYNSYVKTYKRRIGSDGWMRDYVVAFNDLNDKNYDSFVKDLSRLLYKTDYKAAIVELSEMFAHTPYLDYDVNYNITSEELKEWFIYQSEPIVPLEGEADNMTNIASVLSGDIENGMQLYASATPGFIIWVIDKCVVLEEEFFRVNARKFSLDSDLILGAIANDSNVAIIARERCVPITQLPPMRSETLCLLSYTTDEELSQSYERNNLFAGKQIGEFGGKDYAPILLSDALWHTEYGNILNVTDQMLKSWSENGLIDYIDFNYPKPTYWAFSKGVMGDLGVSELTYNWNTEGVGYIVDDNDYSVYALNRTGSLPVSYIPGDATQTAEDDPEYQAEQKAYDFFSSLSNPELVKVVQYAAMYQIFQNFDIHMLYDDIPNYDDNKFIMPEELELEAVRILRDIGRYDSEDRDRIAEYYGASITNDGTGLPLSDDYGVVSNNEELPSSEFGLFLSAYFIDDLDSLSTRDIYNLFHVADVLPQLDTLHQCLSSVIDDDGFINSLGRALVDRNKIDEIEYSESPYDNFSFDVISGQVVKGRSKEERVNDAFNVAFTKDRYIKNYLEVFGNYSCNEAKSMMIAANANRSRTWMKTPTIVESWSLTDSTNQIGGHNLNSKVTRFRVVDDLNPGQTRKVTRGNKTIIEVSKADSRLHITDQAYLRRVGRLDDATIEGTAIRTRSRDIVSDVASRRTARGFNPADHTIKISRNRFVYANKEYESLDKLIVDFCNTKSGDEVLTLHIECLEGAGVQPKMVINNIASRLNRGNTMLPMSKFDFAHATQVTSGDKVLYTIPIKAGKMNLGSTSSVTKAGLGGSSNTGLRVEVCEGSCSFEIINKSKASQIINLVKSFFKSGNEYFNEFKLKVLFKQHDIKVGVDVNCSVDLKLTEAESIVIAKLKSANKNPYDFQLFKEEEIA